MNNARISYSSLCCFPSSFLCIQRLKSVACCWSCVALIQKVRCIYIYVLLHCISNHNLTLDWHLCVCFLFAFVLADKAMAMGIIQFAIGLFGNVPCPIIYGAVIDSTCLVWETICGKQGACSLYDPDTFRHFFLGMCKAWLDRLNLVLCTNKLANYCKLLYF